MKRLSLLVLLFVLLFSLPALADSPVIYPLEENGVLVGSAVLFATENTLLTTAPITAPEQVLLVTEEGKVPLEVYSDPDLMLSLMVAPSPLASEPMALGTLSPEGIFSSGLLSDGTRAGDACRYAAYVQEPSGLTLTTVPGLLPGAVLTNPEGDLCGLIAASLGEGEGRYFALSSAEIYARILNENADVEENASFVEYTASVDGHHVLLDWSGAQGDREGAQYCVYWRDTANSFYTYHPCTALTDSIPCVPGRSYVFCVREIPSGEENLSIPDFSDGYEPILVPGGKQFTDYAFRDTDMHLAFLPSGASAGDTEILPAATIDSGLFTHEGIELYLQVTSTYQVTEEIYADLTCALFAPDGSCYSMLSGFIFAPEYMPQDSWHMEITELFDSCFSAIGVQSGTYMLRYYLDDKLASEITFEIP